MSKGKATTDANLNKPGYIYLNELVLSQIRDATGDIGKGTVDELGLSALYDTMSDILFPWCSTLTSRARYFFFSYSILRLSLEATVKGHLISINFDSRDSLKEANKKRSEFQRNVKKFEKYLAFSLFLKRDDRGIFGINKTKKWIKENRGEVAAKQHSNILSLEGRYPNAIYRASCKKLGMFSNSSETNELIAMKLRGHNPFNSKWEAIAIRTHKEVERIIEFWLERESVPLEVAAQEFKESQTSKGFRGFDLSTEEAHYLFEAIKKSTPYWASVSHKVVEKSFSNEASFLTFEKIFSGQAERHLFESAKHIDISTKFFRDYYSEVSQMPLAPPDINKIRKALPEIKRSKKWLDNNCKSKTGIWGGVWQDYSTMIDLWITSSSLKGPNPTLAKHLMARAEEVVAGRGLNKKPPHVRNRSKNKKGSDTDFSRELNLIPTSFRLRNATLILKDISDGLAR